MSINWGRTLEVYDNYEGFTKVLNFEDLWHPGINLSWRGGCKTTSNKIFRADLFIYLLEAWFEDFNDDNPIGRISGTERAKIINKITEIKEYWKENKRSGDRGFLGLFRYLYLNHQNEVIFVQSYTSSDPFIGPVDTFGNMMEAALTLNSKSINRDDITLLQDRLNSIKGSYYICQYMRYVYSFVTEAFLLGYPGGRDRRFTENDWIAMLERGQHIQLMKDFMGNRFGLYYKQSVDKHNRGPIECILNYSTNVLYYLGDGFDKTSNEVNPPFYGVELEVSTNHSPRDIVNANEELFCIVKSDSSVNGSKRQAFEIVTKPCSLKIQKIRWLEFFKKLPPDESMWDISTSTNNGMHVHIGDDIFRTKKHLRTFVWMLTNPCMEDFILEVSERPNKRDLQRWSNYGDYEKQDKVFDFVRAERMGLRDDHRMLLSVRPGRPTVEVRMFKGIVSYATIVKNLEFVDSMVHASMDMPNMACLDDYLAWLMKTPKSKYRFLKLFLEQLNLEELSNNSKIESEFYGIQDLNMIVGTINKDPRFVANTSVLNYLRKQFPEYKFSLNKKEGIVSYTRTNTGKLYSMDTGVLERFRLNQGA